MNERKPCRKCLLDDLGRDKYFDRIREYIADYPQEKRCSDSEYQRRLDICRSCEQLSDGMCALCGCYVELRALKKEMYCAAKKW